MFEPLDCFGAVGHSFYDFVLRGDGGVGDSFVLELHCVAEAITSCLFDVALVRPIVFVRCSQILTIHGVKSPGTPFVGLLMHLYLASHRG